MSCEFVRQFVALGVDVYLQDLDAWSSPMPDEMRETWLDDLTTFNGAETVLHVAMPSRLRPRPGARNVKYTMFEADWIPAD